MEIHREIKSQSVQMTVQFVKILSTQCFGFISWRQMTAPPWRLRGRPSIAHRSREACPVKQEDENLM